MLTLYDYYRSSASFRTRIALNYKNLPYEKYEVDLKSNVQCSKEYEAINPSCLVPTLQNDDNEFIYQSLAIIEYLEEAHPNSPRLLPQHALDRAYVRELSYSIACDIHPLNNLRVLNYITKELQQNEAKKNEWYQHWLKLGLQSLEHRIKNSKYYTQKFCYRDQFSLADVCLIPQLYNARRFNCDLSLYPTLCNIEKNALLLDAVVHAHPK